VPGESGFVRGLKQSSEVLIYLDIPKVLQDGLLLFKSHNGVVLCPGDLNGLMWTMVGLSVSFKIGCNCKSSICIECP
jgi:2'-phosphotransferase